MHLDNVEDIYPLSATQQGMIFHTLYDPDSSSYFQQVVYTLRGPLSAETFRRAWQAVLDRHPALRTAFLWKDLDAPLQVVRQEAQLRWSEHDWRAASPEQQRDQLASLLDEQRSRGFDLADSPLMSCTLIRIDDERSWFIWNHHHVILDAWSIGLVLSDVFTLHDAFRRGTTAALPTPRLYRDYIAWLQEQNPATAAEFWRQALKGFAAPTVLPGDTAAGQKPAREPRWISQAVRLSRELTADLKMLAQQHKLTLNTLVQGAWALLLSRSSGTSDVVFGVTTAGRPATLPGVESMVGLFINTLPARLQVADAAWLIPWLQALQAQHVQREHYGYSPLVDIHGWSEVPRGTPLFESLLDFENTIGDAENMAQIEQSGLAIDGVRYTGQTNYPLVLVAVPGSELLFDVKYDANRFDSQAISRMLRHLEMILRGMTADPSCRLRDLPWLTSAEYQQIVVDWNATAADYPRAACLHQLFEAQVARTPEQVAVVFGEDSLTYAALNERANQVAHHLQALGIGPERPVGLCVEPSLDMLVGLLAILKAGGAFVPLDLAYPAERLRFMIQDAQLPVLLSHRGLADRIASTATQIVDLDQARAVIAQLPAANPRSPAIAGNLAYIIYTSGSTGRPKGVLISHQGLINYLHWGITAYGAASGNGAPVQSSIAADAIFPSLFLPLLVGTTVILLPESHALDELSAALPVYAPFSLIKITPSQLEVLNRQVLPEHLPGSVHTLVVGAEALRGEILHLWQRHAPDTHIINEYGPTETVVGCSIYDVPPTELYGSVSIGRPIANTQMYVLDRQLNPVPVGVVGELYIGGDGVARGYLNRPDLTAEKFVPDPFNGRAGERLYRSGDLARFAQDGGIDFLGRIDDQVKIRGYRIEPAEIETLLTLHPQVQAAFVLARKDQGEQRLVAYVVEQRHPQGSPSQEAKAQTSSGRSEAFPSVEEVTTGEKQTHDTALSSWELRAYLQQQLPEYMIPSAFVFLEALPLMPNGKTDRAALPAPGMDRPLPEATFVMPRTFVEEELAAIWRNLLHIEQVGVYDNFFVLGGHSLLLMQLASRIHETFEVDIPLRLLFDAMTVVDMSKLIAEQLIAQEDPESLDDLLQEVQQLSPDELKLLLSEE